MGIIIGYWLLTIDLINCLGQATQNLIVLKLYLDNWDQKCPLVLMYGNPKASFWTNLQLCIKDKFILDIPFWIFTAFKSVIKFMKKGNEMAIYKVPKFLLVQTLHQTWFWLSKSRANTIINQSLEHVFIFKLVFFILNACYYL